MSKGKLITISIVSTLLITIVVLFSFVFCLYGEEVTFADDVGVTAEEVINVAGLRHGTPIFAIDKDGATARIEKEYPDIRVDGIRTKSLRRIEYVISRRLPVYTIKSGEDYLILDEDLKLIAVKDECASDLINLNIATDGLEYSLGDFILKDYQHILNEFYWSAYKYIVLPNEDGVDSYLDRSQICTLIDSIEIANRELKITLNNSLNIFIADASDDLSSKVNLAFSTYLTLYKEDRDAGTLDSIGERHTIIVGYNTYGDTIVGIHNN